MSGGEEERVADFIHSYSLLSFLVKRMTEFSALQRNHSHILNIVVVGGAQRLFSVEPVIRKYKVFFFLEVP